MIPANFVVCKCYVPAGSESGVSWPQQQVVKEFQVLPAEGLRVLVNVAIADGSVKAKLFEVGGPTVIPESGVNDGVISIHLMRS